jgi:hypothetical protein
MVGGACYNGDFLYNYKCVVVNAVPLITAMSPITVCVGTPINLSASATGTPTLTYAWAEPAGRWRIKQ